MRSKSVALMMIVSLAASSGCQSLDTNGYRFTIDSQLPPLILRSHQSNERLDIVQASLRATFSGSTSRRNNPQGSVELIETRRTAPRLGSGSLLMTFVVVVSAGLSSFALLPGGSQTAEHCLALTIANRSRRVVGRYKSCGSATKYCAWIWGYSCVGAANTNYKGGLYRAAEGNATINAYEDLITRVHGDSRRLWVALTETEGPDRFERPTKSRGEDNAWADARRQDDVASYLRFVGRFPRSANRSDAEERVRDLRWTAAMRVGTEASRRDFEAGYPEQKIVLDEDGNPVGR